MVYLPRGRLCFYKWVHIRSFAARWSAELLALLYNHSVSIVRINCLELPSVLWLYGLVWIWLRPWFLEALRNAKALQHNPYPVMTRVTVSPRLV